MSAVIETPETLAARLVEDIEVERILGDTDGVFAEVIRADREQITAWCNEHAGAAERESAATPDDRRAHYCDGQACAWRDLAARLGGPGR